MCDVNASAQSQGVEFRSSGMQRPGFHTYLLVLIGVSDACLAYCITLTRRDSIFLNMAEPEALFP